MVILSILSFIQEVLDVRHSEPLRLSAISLQGLKWIKERFTVFSFFIFLNISESRIHVYFWFLNIFNSTTRKLFSISCEELFAYHIWVNTCMAVFTKFHRKKKEDGMMFRICWSCHGRVCFLMSICHDLMQMKQPENYKQSFLSWTDTKYL